MDHAAPPIQAPLNLEDEQASQSRVEQRGASLARNIIQVEANLLCFPFFALAKKDRLTKQAIEVIGSRTKSDGLSESFNLRVSRNSDFGFPGLVSRKVHFAFLGILAEQPRPLENPVTWKWRDLHDRIGIKYAGSDSTCRMKNAIHATAAAYIKTNSALMSKEGIAKNPLPNRETGYHLYDKVMFVNDVLPDGTVSDKNAVWLSDWYLANLNQLYSGPLNKDLWLALEKERPSASRLYEILQFKCCGDIPVLRINYSNLAPLIPIRIESAITKAQEQLNPAFEALGRYEVVRRVEWTMGDKRNIVVSIYPGPALKRTHGPGKRESTSPHSILDFDDLRVLEIFSNQTKEHQLVCRYHALRFGSSRYTPADCELRFAKAKLAVLNESLLNQLLPKIARTMEREFPTGKYFNAADRYVDEIIQNHVKEQESERRRREAERNALEEEQEIEQKKRTREARHRELEQIFRALPAGAQGDLWDEALLNAPSEFDRTKINEEREAGSLHFVLLNLLQERIRSDSLAA